MCMIMNTKMLSKGCADPEILPGGPTLTTVLFFCIFFFFLLVDEWREDPMAQH